MEEEKSSKSNPWYIRKGMSVENYQRVIKRRFGEEASQQLQIYPLGETNKQQKQSYATTDQYMNKLMVPGLGTLKESYDEDYEDQQHI